jgi:hypothetical protein
MLKIKTQNKALILLLMAVSILWMILLPVLVIWSLNLLFTLNIPFTFWTWLAVALIGAFLYAASKGGGD